MILFITITDEQILLSLDCGTCVDYHYKRSVFTTYGIMVCPILLAYSI